MHKASWHDIRPQALTGKVIRLPMHDKEGRPVVLMRPRKEDQPNAGQANVKHVAYHIEMASRQADQHGPDGKILVIMDFSKMSIRKQPPLNISLQVNHMLAVRSASRRICRIASFAGATCVWQALPRGVLYSASSMQACLLCATQTACLAMQNHYPERLHEAVIWHPPTFFNMLWKVRCLAPHCLHRRNELDAHHSAGLPNPCLTLLGGGVFMQPQSFALLLEGYQRCMVSLRCAVMHV